MTDPMLSQNRLRWACRRGMLELDLLLIPFVEEVYPTLETADKIRFEQLLTCPDPKILAWLMGKEEPEDHEIQIIVTRLRQHLPHVA